MRMSPQVKDFGKAAQKAGTGINAPLDVAGHTALHLSVKKGNPEAVLKLLKLNANPHQTDRQGQTPIYEAIAARNLPAVKLLIDYGATFRVEDNLRRTPLMWAIEQKCEIPFLRKLCEAGMSLDAVNRLGHQAMHAAAAANRPEIIDFLAKGGAPLDHPALDGKTPLHLAAENKAYDAAHKLLSNGANACTRTKEIKTPLYLAAAAGDVQMVDMLLSQPAVRHTVDDFRTYAEGYTPLMAAVASNHPAVVEKLLGVGANLNERDSHNHPPLFHAVTAGHAAIVELLLRHGADVEKGEYAFKKAIPMLHRIPEAHCNDILPLLYNAGANMNIMGGNNQTALRLAIDANDIKKVKALLDFGADPNLSDKQGQRPLDSVMQTISYADQGHEIVELLLKKGANPNISDAPDAQDAPLHLAAREGDEKLISLFLEHGAAIDVPNGSDGITPFLAALETGKHAVASLLIEKGADVLKKDIMKRTALHFAARQGSIEFESDDDGTIKVHVTPKTSEEMLDKLLLIPALAQQINAADEGGMTPLHEACSNMQVENAAKLVAAGADPWISNSDGMTPLQCAVSQDSIDVVSFFEKTFGKKVDWNIQTTESKETLLHLAVTGGSAEMTKYLLKMGADPNLKNAAGKTPLEEAVALESGQLIALLKRATKPKNQAAPKAKKPPSP